MSILKLVTNPYDSELAAANLVRYVKNKAVYYGGGAVDPNHAAEQMAMVRRVFDQQNGSLMYHFILAFSDVESKHISTAAELLYDAYTICDYFSSAYQIIFGIHHKDDRWHIHFAMNRVSFIDGRKYRSDKRADSELYYTVRAACFVDNLQLYYE